MKSIKNSLVIGHVSGNVTMTSGPGHRSVTHDRTHAQKEQLVLTYLQTYRETIKLSKFAEACELDVMTLTFFIKEQRGLSAEALAKCLAYLKKQAEAMLVFI